jgi:hypothetical protein
MSIYKIIREKKLSVLDSSQTINKTLSHDYKIFLRREKFKINVALINTWIAEKTLYGKKVVASEITSPNCNLG